jgi:hypothetical protein
MDGSVAVIGAGNEWEDANGQNSLSGAGAAYVFELQGNNQWMAVEKLAGTKRAINDLFGEDAVDVSGSQVVVGAWLADTILNDEVIDGGAIYLYERDTPVTGIMDVEKKDLIMLVNNPSVDGLLHLRYIYPHASPSSDELRIFTLHGHVLYQAAWHDHDKWQVDMSDLPSGMYLVQLSREGYVTQTLKWIRL